MVDHLNLIQLQDLCHPNIGDHQVLCRGNIPDRFLQFGQISRNILDSWEGLIFDSVSSLALKLHSRDMAKHTFS